MSKRRPKAPGAEWSPEALAALNFALQHGFAGEGEFDPPQADRRPPKQWAKAFYDRHRARFRRGCEEGRPISARAVLAFDGDARWRAEARRVAAAWDAQRRRLEQKLRDEG